MNNTIKPAEDFRLKITLDALREKIDAIRKGTLSEENFCSEFRAWAENNFPDGGEFREVYTKLQAAGQPEWVDWLVRNFGTSALIEKWRTDSLTVTVTRTLVYTGSASWVQTCIDQSFVELRKELGNGRSIESEWGEIREVPTIMTVKDDSRAMLNERQGP